MHTEVLVLLSNVIKKMYIIWLTAAIWVKYFPLQFRVSLRLIFWKYSLQATKKLPIYVRKLANMLTAS